MQVRVAPVSSPNQRGAGAMFRMKRLIAALGVAAACGCTALVLGLTATASSAASSSAPPGLMSPGTLIVGMNLQFKPEMYLQNGKPAGYDVDLLNKLAAHAHVKLKIQNLGVQRPDPGPPDEEVRHGLGRALADARAAEGDQLQPGLRAVRPDPRHPREGRQHGHEHRRAEQTRKTITALLGSTAQTKAQAGLPEGQGPRRCPTRTLPSHWSPRAAPTRSSSRTTCWRSSTRPTPGSWSSPRSSRWTCSTAPTRSRRATPR